MFIGCGLAVVLSLFSLFTVLNVKPHRSTDSQFAAKCLAAGFVQSQCYFFRYADVLPSGSRWPE